MGNGPVMAPPGVSAEAFASDAEGAGFDTASMHVRRLSDAAVCGVDLETIRCRSCSGYGNCGYRMYYLRESGGPISICAQRKDAYERDSGFELGF